MELFSPPPSGCQLNRNLGHNFPDSITGCAFIGRINVSLQTNIKLRCKNWYLHRPYCRWLTLHTHPAVRFQSSFCPQIPRKSSHSLSIRKGAPTIILYTALPAHLSRRQLPPVLMTRLWPWSLCGYLLDGSSDLAHNRGSWNACSLSLHTYNSCLWKASLRVACWTVCSWNFQ